MTKAGNSFVVGVGSSGPFAEQNVQQGVARLRSHPMLTVVAESQQYQNPAMGDVTTARFVNAAVVLDTPLSPAALLAALHAVEAMVGRVRGVKNSARALDLDILWGLSLLGTTRAPAVPHPHVLERAFAVVPAVEALQRAALPVPTALQLAARSVSAAARLIVTPRC